MLKDEKRYIMVEMHLCGGTFFELLLQIKKGSQQECLKEWISVVDPQAVAGIKDLKESLQNLKSYASHFKKCDVKSGNNQYINLGNSDTVEAFLELYNSEPLNVYKRVDNYFQKCAKNDEYLKNRMVRKILEIIDHDKNATQDFFLY